MLDFVDAHPDALHAHLPDGPPHRLGAGRRRRPAGGSLLLFHTKLQRWLQPGGHADGDANLAAVALREATEETGIDGLRVVVPAVDLDVHEVRAARRDRPPAPRRRATWCWPRRGPKPQGNHESEALRWVTSEEMPELDVDAGTMRMAERGLAVARRSSRAEPDAEKWVVHQGATGERNIASARASAPGGRSTSTRPARPSWASGKPPRMAER